MFIIFLLLSWRQEKAYVEIPEVHKGNVDFTITAVTTGTVQVDCLVTLTSMISREVSEILAEVADVVKKEVSLGFDIDDLVFIPVETAQDLFDVDYTGSSIVRLSVDDASWLFLLCQCGNFLRSLSRS